MTLPALTLDFQFYPSLSFSEPAIVLFRAATRYTNYSASNPRMKSSTAKTNESREMANTRQVRGRCVQLYPEEVESVKT